MFTSDGDSRPAVVSGHKSGPLTVSSPSVCGENKSPDLRNLYVA